MFPAATKVVRRTALDHPQSPAPALVLVLLGVAAAVTLDAVLILGDALLQMDLADPRARVLVASVAGVAAVIVPAVTGVAGRLVVPVQEEESVVVERGRDPRLLGVALTTALGDLPVQGVLGSAVATAAALHHAGSEQLM
jgi:hypothetical protein